MPHIEWEVAWGVSWSAVLLSGTLLGAQARTTHHTGIQTRLVRWHTSLLWLPVVASFGGLALAPSPLVWGPWRLDRLGWSLSLYIALLSLMIQTFSVRHLHGDRAYPRYFTGLTWVTAAAAATWMSDHVALLAAGWAAMGIFLTALLGLKREWAAVRAVAALSAKRFLLSTAAVGTAAVWLAEAGGSWRLSIALSHTPTFSPWTRAGISALLILAALIQAGGWPFQRWLMESAVAPTPVSAIMHAGVVNAGGLLLTRMAQLFDQSGLGPHLALLGFAGLSVAIGTGVMMVHVDYKRQLVASTMAQMGLMLTLCALGAYGAAVVHLILHGLFKATLFLQSGSVVPRPDQTLAASDPVAPSPAGTGRVGRGLGGENLLAAILSAVYWALTSEPAQVLRVLFLGAGMVLAWRQLAAVREGRWVGLAGVAIAVVAAEGFRIRLDAFVRGAQQRADTGWMSANSLPFLTVTALVLFVSGALIMSWLSARPTRTSARLYLWLVQLGEPRSEAMEAHPRYLAHDPKEVMLR